MLVHQEPSYMNNFIIRAYRNIKGNLPVYYWKNKQHFCLMLPFCTCCIYTTMIDMIIFVLVWRCSFAQYVHNNWWHHRLLWKIVCDCLQTSTIFSDVNDCCVWCHYYMWRTWRRRKICQHLEFQSLFTMYFSTILMLFSHNMVVMIYTDMWGVVF